MDSQRFHEPEHFVDSAISQTNDQAMPHRTIGLTGGIACGKSTVSEYLSHHYALPILDADHIARDAVRPNSPILNALVRRYGADIIVQKDIVQTEGQLDRRKLADIIFQDPDQRRWVESLIHPFVRDRLQTGRTQVIQAYEESRGKLGAPTLPPPTIVMVIPLLFEANMEDLVTEIWVVQCSEDQQIERLMRRNGLSRPQVQQRLNSQMSLGLKAQKADVVLDNQGGRSQLYDQIERAWIQKR